MKTMDGILLAVDFQPATDAAANFAQHLAAACGASVLPLHVLPPMPPALLTWLGRNPKLVRDEAVANLQAIAVRLEQSGVRTLPPVVKYAQTAEAVASAAQTFATNLIVLGVTPPTGSGAVPKWALSQSYEDLVRITDLPVLQVGPQHRQVRLAHVLCVVDCTEESDLALLNAISFCHALEAALTILFVAPPELRLTGMARAALPLVACAPADGPATTADDIFAEYLHRLPPLGIACNCRLTRGDVVEETLRAIEEISCDVLVLGMPSRQPGAPAPTQFPPPPPQFTPEQLSKLLTAPCPILTVRDRDLFKGYRDTVLAEMATEHELVEEGVRQRLEHAGTEAPRLFQQGCDLLRLGETAEAILKLTECVQADEHFVFAYDALAGAYDLQGAPKEARFYRALAKAERRLVRRYVAAAEAEAQAAHAAAMAEDEATAAAEAEATASPSAEEYGAPAPSVPD